MNKIDILGIKVNKEKREEILKNVDCLVRDRKKHFIVTPNPEFLIQANGDREFANVLNQASLAVPDGVGLVWASRFLYGRKGGIEERIPGVDLMVDICRLAARNSWPIFLLGAKEGVAEECALRLKESFPDLTILGTFSGQADRLGDRESRAAIKDKVGRKRCYFIFVAYGAGRQEKWIARNLNLIPVKIAMGVGGAFDFLSGRIRRAPRIFRSLGLEWLWRLIKEPWRWKRQLALPKFVFWVLRKRLLRGERKN